MLYALTKTALALSLALSVGACASLMSSATNRMADNLSTAILDQDDVETVREATPAYLIMLDSLIAGDPENVNMLLAGANLYGAYASAFVEDRERRGRLSTRAFDYGRRAVCADDDDVCEVIDKPYEEFAASVEKTKRADVPAMYGFAAAWAGWVEAHSDDLGAVAQIPKIQALMQRVVELDETYEDGGAHLYIGVLSNLRPAALGGTPEIGREHFERAIEIGGSRDLMVNVLYARYYAKNVFDRPLHDRLLEQVLASDVDAPGLILRNTMAKDEARRLLDEADDYF